MSRFATDVAIVGGGPAGAAAALTLARYTGRRCIVLEASDYAVPRIGETVSPALLPLLAYLGVPPPAVPEAMLPCHGSEAAWGGGFSQRAGIFGSEGGGWSLDRRRFDLALADAAAAAGARVLKGAVLRSALPLPGGGWELRFDRGGATRCLVARQVIDASGRRAAFARRAGAARAAGDRLVGIATYVEHAAGAPARTILVEAARDGWWYCASLPGDRTVIAYMTDADLVRSSGETIDRLFRRALDGTEHIRARIGDAPLTAPCVHPAETRRAAPCIGPDWIAAGDAAASFDPLSSLGIGHALSSGIQAARIVHDRLGGDETLAGCYAKDVAHIHADHARRQAALYAAEGRWPERPFWRRRRAPPAAADAPSPRALAEAC